MTVQRRETSEEALKVPRYLFHVRVLNKLVLVSIFKRLYMSYENLSVIPCSNHRIVPIFSDQMPDVVQSLKSSVYINLL